MSTPHLDPTQAGYLPPHPTFSEGQRRPQVSFKQALTLNKKYLWHFSGRASRSEFWWAYLLWGGIVPALSGLVYFLLLFFITLLAATTTDTNVGGNVAGVLLLTGLAMLLLFAGLILSLIFTLSVGWRRLQDAGFPGALWLLTFVGAGIVPMVMCIFESSPKGLQYDKPEDLNRP